MDMQTAATCTTCGREMTVSYRERPQRREHGWQITRECECGAYSSVWIASTEVVQRPPVG